MWRIRGILIFGVLCFGNVQRGAELSCFSTEQNISCCPCPKTPVTFLCKQECRPAFYETDLQWATCNDSSDKEPRSSSPSPPGGNLTAQHVTQPSSHYDPPYIFNSTAAGDPIVMCKKCDDACASCSGPGPENCTSCAEGFSSEQRTNPTVKCVKIAGQNGSSNISLAVSLMISIVILILSVTVLTGLFLWRRRRRRKSRKMTPMACTENSGYCDLDLHQIATNLCSVSVEGNENYAFLGDDPHFPAANAVPTLPQRQRPQQRSARSLENCPAGKEARRLRKVKSSSNLSDRRQKVTPTKDSYSIECENEKKLNASRSSLNSRLSVETTFLRVNPSNYSSLRSDRNEDVNTQDATQPKPSSARSTKRKRRKSSGDSRTPAGPEKMNKKRTRSDGNCEDILNYASTGYKFQRIGESRHEECRTVGKSKDKEERKTFVAGGRKRRISESNRAHPSTTSCDDRKDSDTDNFYHRTLLRSYLHHELDVSPLSSRSSSLDVTKTNHQHRWGSYLSEESSGYASDDSHQTVSSRASSLKQLGSTRETLLQPFNPHHQLQNRTDFHHRQDDRKRNCSGFSLTSYYVSDPDELDLSKSETEPAIENRTSEEMVSAFTQTDTSSICDGLAPALAEQWQFSKELSSQGGVLQGDNSDVILKVPAGAIDIGEFETIRGAVSTDLPKAHKKLQLPLDEVIASPIIEYSTRPQLMFKTPLEIILPHFLPPHLRNGSVNVYMLEKDDVGRLRVQRLKPLDKSNLGHNEIDPSQDANVFNVEEDEVHIFVKHFTGYFCTFSPDCKEKFSPPMLQLRIYASHIENFRGRRRIAVCLKAWDSRMNIRDFAESDQKSLHEQQLVLIGREVLPRPQLRLGDLDMDSVALGMVLEVEEEEEEFWDHHRDRRGEITAKAEDVMLLHSFVPCKCQPPWPQAKKWHLVNKTERTPDVFECDVFVGYVQICNGQPQSPMTFLPYMPQKVNFHISIPKSVETVPGANNANDDTASKTPSPPRIFNNLVSTERKENRDGPVNDVATRSTQGFGELQGAVGGRPTSLVDDNTDLTRAKESSVTNNFFNPKYVSISPDRPFAEDIQAERTRNVQPDRGGVQDSSSLPAEISAGQGVVVNEPNAPVREVGVAVEPALPLPTPVCDNECRLNDVGDSEA